MSIRRSSNNVSLLHTYQPFGDFEQTTEYRVSDLPTEGMRSIFCEKQHLSLSGYHEIQLCKKTDNGSIGLLKTPICYFIDKKLKAIFNNKITYLEGSFNIEIPFLQKIIGATTVEAIPGKDCAIVPIDDNNNIVVTFPYFKWSLDADNFYSSQLKTPIFTRDLAQNQLIFIDTPFEQIELFFENNNSKRMLLRKVRNDSFDLGEILDESDGTVIAHIGDINRDITLFNITTNPYVVERNLDTVFDLQENGVCIIDFSKCFRHDSLLEYQLSVCLTSESGDEIVFDNLLSDDANAVADEGLIDGVYELLIFWQSVSGGIVGEKFKIPLQQIEIQLGEPLRAHYNSLKTLNLDYFRYESKPDKSEKQKLKGYLISDLKYEETTENDCIYYSGILKSPELKKGLHVYFMVYEKNAIGQLCFRGPNDEMKFLNYDIYQKHFTFDESDATRVFTLKRIIISK